MVNQILKTNKLSKTRGRQEILKVLVESQFPLSGKEIADALGHLVDRTTVYRTLNTFEEKQLVHKVMADNVWRYVLTATPVNDDKEVEHVHFKCVECCRLICLHEVKMDDFQLPDGFKKLENNILITGICRECTNNMKT
jgi:Fur family ferric uptake transcriptional regulator